MTLNRSATQATHASTTAWLDDLRSMLSEAKSRFADVVWITQEQTEIYAHKSILYARASGAFQQKYLTVPSLTTTSTLTPGESNLSLPSPRSSSSASTSLDSTGSALIPISLVGTDAALFAACLDFLCAREPFFFLLKWGKTIFTHSSSGITDTGNQTMQFVFTMLFEGFEEEGGEEDGGIDRLRQDLLFAWRSKLFADVHLILEDQDATGTSTSFAVHRSILASRSPYFHSLFLGGYSDSRQLEFTLPSPLFTPASTSFVLGYIYTATLEFSGRSFDLNTAFEIYRCAIYLSLGLLQDEMEIKIESMLNPKRAARVYAFAVAADVQSAHLSRITLELLAKSFGDLWNCAVIGNLEIEERSRLVGAVEATMSSSSITEVTKKCFSLRKRIELERAEWARNVREMVEAVEQRLRIALANDLHAVVISASFIDLIDGIGFSTDILEFLLELVVGGLTESNAAENYQALVGAVLLRENGMLMDARVLVEESKNSVLKFIKSRWLGIRASRSFDRLESWCLTELSDELDIPVDDLLANSSSRAGTLTSRTGLRVTLKRPTTPSSTPDATTRTTLNRSLPRMPLPARSPRSVSPLPSPRPPPRLTSSINPPARTVVNNSARNNLIVEPSPPPLRRPPVVRTRSTTSDVLSTSKTILRVPSNRSIRATTSSTQLASNSSSRLVVAPLRSPAPSARSHPVDTNNTMTGSIRTHRPSSAASTTLRKHTSTPSIRAAAAILKPIVPTVVTSSSPSIRRPASSNSIRSVASAKASPAQIIPAKRLSPKSAPRLSLPPALKVKLPGTTLIAGVPCIVTSRIQGGGGGAVVKSIRFKALVRYIGATLFGSGQWVGVEVAISSLSDLDTRVEELEWNDGEVDGVRYFTLTETSNPVGIGRSTTPDLRMTRSIEGASSSSSLLLPPVSRSRRASSMDYHLEEGPRRGLFVRPHQIVYVL